MACAYDEAGEKDDADGVDLLQEIPSTEGVWTMRTRIRGYSKRQRAQYSTNASPSFKVLTASPARFTVSKTSMPAPSHGRPALFRVPAHPVVRAGRADRAWTGPVSEGLVKAGKEGLPLRRKHPLLEIAGRRFAFEEKGMGIILKDVPRLLGCLRVGRAGRTPEMGASESASEGGPIGHVDLLDRDRKDPLEAEGPDS